MTTRDGFEDMVLLTGRAGADRQEYEDRLRAKLLFRITGDESVILLEPRDYPKSSITVRHKRAVVALKAAETALYILRSYDKENPEVERVAQALSVTVTAKRYAEELGWTLDGSPVLTMPVGWHVQMKDKHGNPQTVYFGTPHTGHPGRQNPEEVSPFEKTLYSPPEEAKPEKVVVWPAMVKEPEFHGRYMLPEKGEVEQMAIRLRVAARVVGLSARQTWNEISEKRRQRWIDIASILLSSGFLLVEREDLERIRDLARGERPRASSAALEKTIEAIDGLLGNGSKSDDADEDEESDASILQYGRSGDTVLLELDLPLDELKEVAFGLFRRLGMDLRAEFVQELGDYQAQKHFGSPLSTAVALHPGGSKEVNLNSYMPRGGKK